MNRIFGFLFSILLILPFHVMEKKQTTNRRPASLETQGEKRPEVKKIQDNYSEHLFNQVTETPVKAFEKEN